MITRTKMNEHTLRIINVAKALSIMRCQDDINTEHNMKSIGRAAVAQWTNRLTRKQRFFWTLDAGGENVTRGWE